MRRRITEVKGESVKTMSGSMDAVRVVQEDNGLKSSDWIWNPGLG